jgi:hypothetical protein
VHALSRSQKEEYPQNVTHDHIDLKSDVSSMAKQLQGVAASHIFFAAYLQEDSEQGNWDSNGAMLSNFLCALSQNGALQHLKRFILVTGAKKYGCSMAASRCQWKSATRASMDHIAHQISTITKSTSSPKPHPSLKAVGLGRNIPK